LGIFWQNFAAAENDGHLIGGKLTSWNSKVLNGLAAAVGYRLLERPDLAARNDGFEPPA